STLEELTAAGDMSLAFEAVGAGAVPLLYKDRSSDSERGIFAEPVQKEFEIILLERDVGVQIPHDVVVEVLDGRIAGVEAMHLGGEAAIAVRRHVHHADPIVEGGVPGHDRRRSIRGAVVHDHPSARTSGSWA